MVGCCIVNMTGEMRLQTHVVADLEKQVKDRTKIEAHITQIIDNNVKEELGEAFFEEKAFTKDEMHLYFKSNLQLGYIYSKRASEVRHNTHVPTAHDFLFLRISGSLFERTAIYRLC